jgi:hypothetical protein
MKAQKLWRSSLVIAAILPAALGVACSSKIGGGEPGFGGPPGSTTGPNGVAGGSSGTSGGSGSGASGSSGGSAPGGPVPVVITGTGSTPVPESAGPMVMRRLTYREYDNMLNDLIGDTTAPAVAWSADAPNATGFIGPSSVADLQVSLYNSTADTLVEAALAAGKISIPCTNPTAAQESACATQFIQTFGLRAYRRPIATAEQTDLMTLFTTVRGLGLSFTESIAAVVKGMLQSPNFLYHWEIGPTKPVVGADGLVPLTQWQVASRLAMSLWNSTPDATLLQAAQAGQLGTAAQVTTQATRMLADPRAAQALYDFHQQWLLVVGVRVTDLSQTGFSPPPSGLLTAAGVAALQTEFTSFLTSVYSGDGTLNTLLTAPYAFINKDLAPIYGVTPPASGFAKVALNPLQRGGLFTQTAFLASFANGTVDHPIYRGLSIYTKLMCGNINPPPANVPGANFKSGGTTRSAYEAHAANTCAQGCHNLFDPPGFAFENYDGNGVYRTMESGVSVDSTGTFTTPAGATIAFNNALDLEKKLAASSEVQVCYDRQWTRYMLARMETMAEQGSLELALAKGTATTGFSLRDMLTTLVSSKSYMYRTPSPGEQL